MGVTVRGIKVLGLVFHCFDNWGFESGQGGF